MLAELLPNKLLRDPRKRNFGPCLAVRNPGPMPCLLWRTLRRRTAIALLHHYQLWDFLLLILILLRRISQLLLQLLTGLRDQDLSRT